MFKAFWVLIFISLKADLNKCIFDKDEENFQTLTNDLLKDYNKNVRPDTPVNIKFDINLRQIVSIDEKNQIMTTNTYFEQEWNDSRLAWNPVNRNGITETTLPLTQIWIPDTTVINAASANPPGGFFTISNYHLATVTHTGLVHVFISAISLQTRCAIDIRKFPFDTQVCSIHIGSWAQNKDWLTYETVGIFTDDYIDNTLWRLGDTKITENLTRARLANEDDDEMEDLIFHFNLSRMPLYFMINGIFPCLVLNFITLGSFFLPFSNQIGLIMTSFLTFSVYSLRISSEIPVQSEYMPMIVLYFLLSTIFAFISFNWFLVQNLFVTKSFMPKFLMKIADGIDYIFCCAGCKKSQSQVNPPQGQPSIVNIEDIGEMKKEPLRINSNGVLKQRFKTENIEKPEPPKKPSCSKCECCIDCEKKKSEEDAKKQKKESIEKASNNLNIGIFLITFILMTSSNLYIWLYLSS